MIPLAERMRPTRLNEVIGQEHLTSEGRVLHNAIKTGHLPSLIFWGPPGVGKTTLALLLANELNRTVYTLSAISSGVKDIREIISIAEINKTNKSIAPILFLDEIHRFNKSQQDSLLGAIEKGLFTLIGATTENPSFEVNNALLSRMQVYILNALTDDDLLKIAHRIIEEDELFKNKKVNFIETDMLIHLSSGDARRMCNLMELLGHTVEKELHVTNELIGSIVDQNLAQYDKGAELHYDIISAFIKSIRGSDPNAALYWFARMLLGGEDPNFISRRMVILAAEDIGLANPNALLIAQAAQQSVHLIGWPEGRIILSEAIIYVACSPKSNSAYIAIEAAIEAAKKYPNASVPLHLRNSVTTLMKDIGYGKNYKYGHQFNGNFTQQNYLPEELSNLKIYTPGSNASEAKILENLKLWWKEKYDY